MVRSGVIVGGPRMAAAPLGSDELTVIALLAIGLNMNEVAHRLGIHTSTVYNRTSRACKRARCATLYQLMFEAGKQSSARRERTA